ncbi:MAG TPA: hypothetical protein PLC42_06925 [Parachlamydiaceae bacterium]|nr:hypothetical protein [Parachlamydiaceae bacterium]
MDDIDFQEHDAEAFKSLLDNCFFNDRLHFVSWKRCLALIGLVVV